MGKGIEAGSTALSFFVSLLTSGNGTSPFESNERRAGPVLEARVGVKGGVMGSFDRLVAVAPRRCSGVSPVLEESANLLGAGVLDFTASGILDFLDIADDIGEGK
jgi:hypothetical protein